MGSAGVIAPMRLRVMGRDFVSGSSSVGRDCMPSWYPALRKGTKGRAPHCVADARKIKWRATRALARGAVSPVWYMSYFLGMKQRVT
ncbi:MAG: hypothetical protein WBV55_21945 [Candidatus Sulfotelmatobacter sp.]